LVRFQKLHRFWDSVSSILPREVKVQLAFFIGLLVGGVLSIIAFILLFSSFLFGALQALVAAGTLALAGVTSYVTVRDRREALARELADRVYVPMRKDALAWQNPESLPHSWTWDHLEGTAPYLTAKVPSDLRNMFEKARSLDREITLYNRAVYDFIRSQSLGSKVQTSNTIVRMMKGNEPLGDDVSMMNLWKSGKTLEQYVADSMARSYPLIKEWRLELWTDIDAPGGTGTVRQQIGETKESIEYTDKLLKFLASKPEAVTYQQRYKELAEVGANASERIEKELRKPVAPMSSSPAKEPGNPFG